MISVFRIALAALVLLGLTVGHGAAAADAHVLELNEIVAVKRKIASGLKDPESARFGAMSAVRNASKQAIYVCGFVNAKNSYGGYAGNTPFFTYVAYVANTKTKTKEPYALFASVGGSNYQNAVVRSLCRDEGLYFN